MSRYNSTVNLPSYLHNRTTRDESANKEKETSTRVSFVRLEYSGVAQSDHQQETNFLFKNDQPKFLVVLFSTAFFVTILHNKFIHVSFCFDWKNLKPFDRMLTSTCSQKDFLHACSFFIYKSREWFYSIGNRIQEFPNPVPVSPHLFRHLRSEVPRTGHFPHTHCTRATSEHLSNWGNLRHL
jgi:hypothetical protein